MEGAGGAEGGQGICPSCGSRTGAIGDACLEPVCARKGYSLIPEAWFNTSRAWAARKRRPLDPLIGREVDRYLLVGKLGEGGMGAVYAAIQRPFLREVAIKIISGLDMSAATLARFEAEARAIALLDHPNIVKLYEYGIADLEFRVPFIALEYVRHGRTLGPALARVHREQGGIIPGRVVLRIFEQVLNAIGAAHARGIVHRDMKPDNIMVAPVHGNPYLVKILDFGLAKAVAGTTGLRGGVSNAGEVLGTPVYMAPEQVVAQGPSGDVDGRADLYAVAVILFEAFTGAIPFPGDNPFTVLTRKIDPQFQPLDLPEARSLPPGLRAFLAKGLSIDPSARFATATGMVEALREVLAWPETPAVGLVHRRGQTAESRADAYLSGPTRVDGASRPGSAGATPEPSPSSAPTMGWSSLLEETWPAADPDDPGFEPPIGDVDLPTLLEGAVPVRRVPAGRVVFRQGDHGDTMIVVQEGALRVEVGGNDGHKVQVGEIGPGEVVGEMTCLDSAPRSATVSAVVESQLMELDRGTLQSLRASMPAVFVGVLRQVNALVTRRIRHTDGLIERVAGEAGAGGRDLFHRPSGEGLDSPPAPRSAAFSAAELAHLADLAGSRHFSGGDVLCREGEAGASCFVLLHGALEVRKRVAGREVRLALLGDGGIIGQMALIDDQPRSATVSALGEVTVVELGRARFEELLATFEPLAMRFQEQIAVAGIRQLRAADRWLTTRLSKGDEAPAAAAGEGPEAAAPTPVPAAAPARPAPVDDGVADRDMVAFLHAALHEWGMSMEDLDRVQVVRTGVGRASARPLRTPPG